MVTISRSGSLCAATVNYPRPDTYRIWYNGITMKRLLLLLTLIIWTAPALADTLPVADTAPQLTIEFLDVGQGDAILLRLPGGGIYLVDAGPGRTQALDLLRARGIKHLDGMLLTHPHADHCGGMPAILRAITVDTFYESGKVHTAPSYRDTLRAAVESGAGYATVKRGDTLAWDPEVQIEVLHPDTIAYSDLNANSVVLRLIYNHYSVLLTGDATSQSEQSMLTALPEGSLRADVLKVGHHGSKGSSSTPFLTAVQAWVDIIMCARVNSYHHPHPETMARLNALPGGIFSTATGGTVRMEINATGWMVDDASAQHRVFWARGMSAKYVPMAEERDEIGHWHQRVAEGRE